MARQSRQWYKKYRWFFTSNGKLVIGGKSAEQNEHVVKKYLQKEDVVMHTAQAGSPFAVIKSQDSKITVADLREAAVFTASFSRAWREGKKKAEIHVFKPEQIVKEKGQKTGTFTVIGEIHKVKASLKLALTFQKERLRAVPFPSAEKKSIVLQPGRITKKKAAEIIDTELKKFDFNLKKEEILNALPTGKFSIKNK